MIKGGRYLVIGDSTTCYNLQNDNFDGTKLYCHRLAAWIRDNYGPIRVIHKGVSGTQSTQWAQPMLRWGTQVGACDLVTIGLGMNDGHNSVPTATFQASLQTLINRLRRYNPNVLIVLCTPNTVNPNQSGYIFGTMQDSVLTPYRSMCDTVAAGYSSGVYVCHFENGWATADTTHMYDGVHPNGTGHGALYNLLQPIVQQNCASWLNGLGAQL